MASPSESCMAPSVPWRTPGAFAPPPSPGLRRPRQSKVAWFSSRRWQEVAVVFHAGLRVLQARDAVRPIVLRNASADRVLVVEPHRQNARPGDRISGAATEAPLALSQLCERDVGRVVIVWLPRRGGRSLRAWGR